jgi:hypothetical protein
MPRKLYKPNHPLKTDNKVSNLPKEDFNKELDSYIKRRKGYGSGFFNFSFPEAKPGEAEIIVQESAGDDDFSEEEVMLAMEGKLERREGMQAMKKQGFLSRLFGAGRRDREKYYKSPERLKGGREQGKGTVSEEAAEVLTIAGKWLNRLDNYTKQEFKDSSDYAKYKYLIEKIRKQQ